jgi:hypothetical protein
MRLEEGKVSSSYGALSRVIADQSFLFYAGIEQCDRRGKPSPSWSSPKTKFNQTIRYTEDQGLILSLLELEPFGQ